MRFQSLKLLKTLISDPKLNEFLSDEVLKKMKTINVEKIPLKNSNFLFKHISKDIHYSWFIPFLEKIKEKKLFISILDDQKKLYSYFQIPTYENKLPLWIQEFFKKTLFEHFFENDYILPKEYIIKSDFSVLLNFSKKKLTDLIDFLSLFDLSKEIKSTIDSKITKKIYSFLSKKQKDFLKTLLHYKEPFSFAKIDVKKSLKNKKDFKLLLHKIGLNRFSKFLCMQDNNLIWYICHKLDIGRGSYLYKLCKQKQNEKIAFFVKENVMKLIPLVNKKVVL